MTQTSEILERLNKIESLHEGQQPQPLTPADAAEYLHVSKQTLYRMTSKSEVVHFKPNGKKIYFLKRDLDEWIVRNRVSTREEG